MKFFSILKRLLPVAGLVLAFLGRLDAQNTHRCGADSRRDSQIEKNEHYLLREQAIEEYTKKWINETGSSESREIHIIPVVVHIVWKESGENVSDLQIRSQIAALNIDFNKLNEDQSKIPAEFADLAANAGIEFCLATLDPKGNPTMGITRTQTDIDCAGRTKGPGNKGVVHYTNLGGQDVWDPNSYLNIWVANMCDGIELGIATFPAEAGNPEDGIVIDYRNFGTIGIARPPYNLGRTLTHEVGHYLNLKHTWGDNLGGCNTDDGVDDTPLQAGIYFGCPKHPQTSCGSNDMFMNYMNYVDDDCMYLFTEGQKLRMLAALLGPRASLLESQGCALEREFPFGLQENAIQVFPNPSSSDVYLDIDLDPGVTLELTLFDRAGKKLVQQTVSSNNFRPFDVSSLAPGLYFLQFFDGQRRITKKLIIQR